MSLFSRMFGNTDSDQVGMAIEEIVTQAIIKRRSMERRWYDNNFFDDGYHFRVISRKTGRIIDTVQKNTGYVERAIPRASKQIRGTVNMLYGPEPYPVVYPERIIQEDFMKDGQMDQQAYQQALEAAKITARMKGKFISVEWEDEQHLPVKMVDALLKASKHSISWCMVASDTDRQKIITDIFDAFDIICYGEVDDENKLPFITKTEAVDFMELRYDESFPEEKRARLTPDNRYATAEIKNAYMRARYGTKLTRKETDTIQKKETFLKEVLTESNWKQTIELSKETGAMEGKSKGDTIMRHVYSCGGVTLNDEYIDYDKYPLIPIRLEPGPLYQVPLIERFIPLNKSQDVVVTRIEKWINTMVIGAFQQRKGENFEISNFPGGQVLQYEQAPLEQLQVGNVGQTPFAYLEMIDKYIEEQGFSTSVLGKIPQGVKANQAIENLQQQEYQQLKVATMMLKLSLKKITEAMLERAHKDFLEPVEYSYEEDNQVHYFDVIGKRGYDLSKKINKKLPPNLIIINKDSKVRIEIEPGLGLTMDGKRQTMQSIIDYMLKLYQEGFLSVEAMTMTIKRFLESFGYGSTEEFMEAVENGVTQGQMTQQTIQQMQIAILKTLKDAQMVGPQAQQNQVLAAKVGTLESLKESGLIKHIQTASGLNDIESNKDKRADLDDMVRIYEKAPEDIRRQVEQALGLQPSTKEPIAPQQVESAKGIHEIIKGNYAMKNPPQPKTPSNGIAK